MTFGKLVQKERLTFGRFPKERLCVHCGRELNNLKCNGCGKLPEICPCVALWEFLFPYWWNGWGIKE